MSKGLPFVPSAGGTLPSFTELQPIEGNVGGFLVYSSTRHYNWFGTETYAELNMSFPDAATYGAETLVLQYKKNDGSWTNFLNNETEITTTGNNFSLELYQTYTFRLLLRGGAKKPVSSVTKSSSSGVFQINASLSLDKSPYSLQNNSSFWKICTEMFFGQFSDLMEGTTIDLAANSVGQIARETALNIQYDATSKQVRFESTSMVKEVSMFSLTGSLIGNWKISQLEGRVSVGDVTPGVYVMQFMMDKGSVARKVVIAR